MTAVLLQELLERYLRMCDPGLTGEKVEFSKKFHIKMQKKRFFEKNRSPILLSETV